MKRCFPDTTKGCHPNNPCAGKYGDCLDVKLTNQCNGNCSFCVERGGYNPQVSLPATELARVINDHKAPNVLLLGGEPTLYPELGTLLELISPEKRVHLTTNGTLLDAQFVLRNNFSRLNGLNISIHHFDRDQNARTLGLTEPVDFSKIKGAVDALGHQVSIRINCNLTRDGIHDMAGVKGMILLARWLKIPTIRFAELQGVSRSNGWVDSRLIWPQLSKEPFTGGCEHEVETEGFKYTVRQTCGWVCPGKSKPGTTKGKNPRTQVLYNNGEVRNGWSSPIYPPAGCHEPDRRARRRRMSRRSALQTAEAVGNCHRSDGCH